MNNLNRVRIIDIRIHKNDILWENEDVSLNDSVTKYTIININMYKSQRIIVILDSILFEYSYHKYINWFKCKEHFLNFNPLSRRHSASTSMMMVIQKEGITIFVSKILKSFILISSKSLTNNNSQKNP